MTLRSAPLSDDARMMLAAVLRAGAFALAALPRGPAALVIIHRDRAPELVALAARTLGQVLRSTPSGHWVAALPLDAARAAAVALAPTVAPTLEEPVRPGEVWALCLLAPDGAGSVPVMPTTAPKARGPAS